MREFCICYASSNEYAQYTGISLLSLLENNREIIDRVYLLNFGIRDNNIIILRKIAAMYEVEIEIIDALDKMSELFASLGMQIYDGSYATYARAFIDKIIDNYDGKLLYIDSDTIVNGSLLPLKKLDLSKQGKVYGGIIGMNQYIFPYNEVKLETGNKKYYACGVLLYDINMWRKMRCTERIIDYINKSPNKNFRYADQTVINNSIPESLVFTLRLEYNYWGHMFRGDREIYELTRNNFYSVEQVLYAKNNPVIIHYKGYIVHPWLQGNVSSLASLYHMYKKKSPWKDVEEKTIYYSEAAGMETVEQIQLMKETKRFLRRSVVMEMIIEKLIEIKHKARKIIGGIK